MKTRHHLFLLLLFVAGALFSFQTPVEPTKMDDQTFVNKAAASNQFEIEAGRLASTKARRQSVKDFGQKMVDDHTRVGKDLKSVAKSKNLEVPKKLPSDKERDLERLRSSSDDNFDMVFMELVVTSHQEAVDLFTKASGADGVSDRELKAFAAEKLPNLQHHLNMAKELQSKNTN